MANKNLINAKRAKNDEFYTHYSDIQKEIEAYLDYNPNVFRNKVVYCNCDDPNVTGSFKVKNNDQDFKPNYGTSMFGKNKASLI